jgi:signal transduction histidine kinase
MTLNHLAARLGITKQRVSALSKMGMPVDSFEAAEAWRAERATQTKTKRQARPKTTSPEEQAATVEGDGWRGLDAVERIKRHREELESRLDFASAEARRWKDSDPELSRKWLALASQLAARAPLLESKLADAHERAKVTVTTADAQRTFIVFFNLIRNALETAPAGLAGKVNPNDFLHAREVLEHWRDSLFRRLHEFPRVTPPEVMARIWKEAGGD